MSPTRRRLLIQPVAILIAFGAWVLWRSTATLDSIESRQLAWSEINTLAVQHLEVTAVAAAVVLVVAIPLGIVLTRPRFRRASTA
ncbi:MAG: ABC transporter permease, partial [Oryzihumus sp.]